jgi:regulatory protein
MAMVSPSQQQQAKTEGSARLSALRILAQRRLTEAQLWSRLERKGFPHEAIAAAVATCKRDGYLDDKLYAELYVHGAGARKALGDVRLVATLVAKGVDPEIARASVAAAPSRERERCIAALEGLERKRPGIGYPSAARALERLGFPASLIYSVLRGRIGASSLS